jgi:hypothetical protein
VKIITVIVPLCNLVKPNVRTFMYFTISYYKMYDNLARNNENHRLLAELYVRTHSSKHID